MTCLYLPSGMLLVWQRSCCFALMLFFPVTLKHRLLGPFIVLIHTVQICWPPSHFIQFVTLNRARPKQSIPAGDFLLNGLHVARSKLVLLSLSFSVLHFSPHVPQTNILLPFDLSKWNCLLCRQSYWSSLFKSILPFQTAWLGEFLALTIESGSSAQM